MRLRGMNEWGNWEGYEERKREEGIGITKKGFGGMQSAESDGNEKDDWL